MFNPQYETKKRISLAERIADQFRDSSLGVVLTGSVAYAPNLNVTNKSDLDMIIVVEDLKKSIPNSFVSEENAKKLKNRFFEGYCFKKETKGVPTSLHLLSRDAFDIICKCFVADIRVFRPDSKPGSYILKAFDGRDYTYQIKNIPLEEFCGGVRTIVPISFINKDRYFIGIHRDKLLSNPKVLHEQDEYVASKIDKLWTVIVENLIDESLRLQGKINLNKRNVLNALAKKDKMSDDIRSSIIDKMNFYLKRVK